MSVYLPPSQGYYCSIPCEGLKYLQAVASADGARRKIALETLFCVPRTLCLLDFGASIASQLVVVVFVAYYGALPRFSSFKFELHCFSWKTQYSPRGLLGTFVRFPDRAYYVRGSGVVSGCSVGV